MACDPLTDPAVTESPGTALWTALAGAAAAPPAGHRPFFTVTYGGGPAAVAADAERVDWPLRQLGSARAELWTVDSPLRRERAGEVRLALAETVALGAVEVAAGVGRDLEAAARRAYRQLLEALAAAGFPHPLRAWNVLPGINESDGPLERYRRFCRGRAEAFEGHFGAGFTRRLCASTAVGSRRSELAIHLLAGRLPGVHHENPRQVAAWAYPQTYGPRSPSFARATRTPGGLGGHLLISGTASIVGHRSRHPGSVARQLAETLDNLDRLAGPGAVYRYLKVYLRDRRHLGAVRAGLAARYGGSLPALFLEADICRRELLLEIEAVAA